MKRNLTTKCKKLIKKTKVTELEVQNAISTVKNQDHIKLTRAKTKHARVVITMIPRQINQIRWERDLKCRQVRYLESKTQAIRNLTVKGLEPELKRLMDLHYGDITDLRNARADVITKMGFEQDAKLSRWQLALARTISKEHRASEHQEFMSLEERIVHVKNVSTLGKNVPAKASKRSSFNQPNYDQAQTKLAEELDFEHKQLFDVLTSTQLSLACGQDSVSQARMADRVLCTALATVTCKADLNNILAAVMADLASCRDSAIDNLIFKVQASTLAWEDNETHLIRLLSSKLKESHLATTAGLRVFLRRWFDRTTTVTSGLQQLQGRLRALRTIHAAIELSYRDVLCFAIQPHQEGQQNSKRHKANASERRFYHLHFLRRLDHEYEAAETARSAITIELDTVVTTHAHGLTQCAEVHQQLLAVRNREVRFGMDAKTKDEAGLKQAVDLELVRNAHLSKVISCYVAQSPDHDQW
mmetsp:Transcript_30915/g.95676  ORF Transcript_30915/g.95676 Transcript_30915/m.95676 type:complete len:473 (+) Transcript_30915:366-1784(+)